MYGCLELKHEKEDDDCLITAFPDSDESPDADEDDEGPHLSVRRAPLLQHGATALGKGQLIIRAFNHVFIYAFVLSFLD